MTGYHRLGDYGSEMIADLRGGTIVRVDDVRLDPRTCHEATLTAYREVFDRGVPLYPARLRRQAHRGAVCAPRGLPSVVRRGGRLRP